MSQLSTPTLRFESPGGYIETNATTGLRLIGRASLPIKEDQAGPRSLSLSLLPSPYLVTQPYLPYVMSSLNRDSDESTHTEEACTASNRKVGEFESAWTGRC